MSRRDTIIIAVLVNAGLLMVLFATAMRSNKKEESKVTGSEMCEVPPPATPLETVTPAAPLAASADAILDAPVGSTLPTENSEVAALGEEIDLSSIEPSAETAVVAPVPAPAPVAAVEAKREEPEIVNVTVKKGDVLEKIAKTHKTTVAAIMKASNISSTNLKIGQVLKVPQNAKKESPSTSVAKKEVASPSKDAEYYTVKEGDSPWLIASRNNVKLDELLRLNGMDEQKARRLRPGDKLRIR